MIFSSVPYELIVLYKSKSNNKFFLSIMMDFHFYLLVLNAVHWQTFSQTKLQQKKSEQLFFRIKLCKCSACSEIWLLRAQSKKFVSTKYKSSSKTKPCAIYLQPHSLCLMYSRLNTKRKKKLKQFLFITNNNTEHITYFCLTCPFYFAFSSFGKCEFISLSA